MHWFCIVCRLRFFEPNMKPMHLRALLPTLFLALLLLPTGIRAAVTLPDVFTDHLVLQRQQRVPVWGTAAPGEQVHVSFGGQTEKTRADSKGNWRVFLGPFEANEQPATLTVVASNRIELKDILVGEVWFCSGQSNMQWTLEQSAGGAAAIAAADYPHIRLFNVSREVAFKRKTGVLATWQPCTPESVRDFSGIGFFFGLELYRSLHIPVGLINSSYGGSQIEAWTPVEFLAANPELQPCIDREKIWAAERPAVQAAYDQDVANWKVAVEAAKAAGTRPPSAPKVPDALRDYRLAASIYNTMVAPIIPYAIRGAMWYQGESNEDRAEQYEILLPTMIEAWRARWDQGNFPFAIVQLPNYRAISPEPIDEAWSHIRDAQRTTSLRVPQTGLIVTIDVGEAADIHPTNKLTVGKRLWHWAMASVYGQQTPAVGPVFDKVQVAGNKLVLSFRETGQGLRTIDGQALRTFAVAGEDKQFVWAQARIIAPDKIEVWADGIANPVAVRYAFNNNPENPNLSNETGIPASPFRSDKWPDPTAGKR